MYLTNRAPPILVLGALSLCCDADEPDACFQSEVEDHVLEQFAVHGPQSTDRETFGFIFRADGVISSAIVRGTRCAWREVCEVDTRRAAAAIPPGAKVLGEWHTHPHETGSRWLSIDDVRGANRNRHIRCYRAFVSLPDGEVLSWDPNMTSVPTAMSTFVPFGNYRDGFGRLAACESASCSSSSPQRSRPPSWQIPKPPTRSGTTHPRPTGRRKRSRSAMAASVR